jgi:hypothetical protein
MVPLNTVFWGLVIIFGLIGALRGWAKEIIVSFTVLLAMFIQQVFGDILGSSGGAVYLPPLLPPQASYSKVQFWVCVGLLLMLTFFGYAGPTLATRAGAKIAREHLQDALLGFFLGLLNGYLIFGMVWFYLHSSNYIIGGIQPPAENSAAWVMATRYLPPLWISEPLLYVSIALAFVFVIIVFV